MHGINLSVWVCMKKQFDLIGYNQRTLSCTRVKRSAAPVDILFSILTEYRISSLARQYARIIAHAASSVITNQYELRHETSVIFINF